ncbi:response regulator [Burkholderia ambifaria]|uniref:response regulator n=1 Tax=Burkholderia ambifaria TaxID=152480 RepID=UPI001B96E711|nr:response regulator [Burkholderia ambifaria]MBR8335456.1 response regulator [Burkholderia ambifaria]
MTKLHFLCVDDHVSDLRTLVTLLEQVGSDIKFTSILPGSFESMLETIRHAAPPFDGVLLDLRLDQNHGAAGANVHYNAAELATLFRGEMANKRIPDIPIVLWTISAKLKKSYTPNPFSHDLFDLVLDKEKIGSDLEYRTRSVHQMASVSRGFKEIIKSATSAKTFADFLTPPSTDFLDPRIGSHLAFKGPAKAISNIARFILLELVGKNGPLIDERTLCARLGVTISSFQDSTLQKHCTRIGRYKGPFSDGWSRWWWPAIDAWWNLHYPDLLPMIALDAAERVDIFNRTFKKSALIADAPIDNGYSTKFSTCCAVLDKPIDRSDGYMLALSVSDQPWHDRSYVSRKVVTSASAHRFDKSALDSIEFQRAKNVPSNKRNRT